ncbi:MAG TPA: RNB domain-containing ribonuclease [Quisquiliibacterium sp.]|nr:RNB domain-containing ribonuclease [Quisquiliibacterium sp.]
MTHVLFEEDGGFKAGTVLSEAPASLQVEHASGKRSKVKTGHVVLRFEAPSPSELLPAAQRVAEGLDIDFLWECAPQDEFGFDDLAGDYFGGRPDAVQAAAVLLKLQGAPIYFQRKGKGRYRPAPAETVRLALAAVERRRQQELALEEYSQAMIEGRLPGPIAERAAALLVRPDKQSIEYRALERACERTRRPPERLLLELGAFASPRELHFARFACEHFPQGTGFAALPAPPSMAGELPLAPVEAFSIDDSTTTEIDDALSVQALPDGRLRVGIHIAAPALAIGKGDAIDSVARERMSTVYMPGGKITMLPEEAIRPFSLDEGTERPALSLYADLDAAGTAIERCFSQVERVRIAANLRHDALDAEFTEEALGDPAAPLPYGEPLRALWKLTLALAAGREKVRGKPEPRGRADFSFYVDGDRVRIVQRRRDSPLDRIVAEMAILANSEWGRLLAEHKAVGVYRSQQMGRVKMGTHALPHQGLGVAQYAWSTSPLRRYIDLTNQRQLVAVLRGEKPAFASNDSDIFSIISAFDAKYAAYGDFQTSLERYWCLRWLVQEGITRAPAVVVRDDLVRLADAPFYFRLADLPALAAGRRILVDVLSTDEVELTLQARFVEVAPAAQESPAAGLTDEEADEAEFTEEG